MIRIYDEGDHPAGFVGVRVVVSFPDKPSKQKYFNFWDREKAKWVSKKREKELIKEATDLEAEWKKESAQELKEKRLKPGCKSNALRQIAYGLTWQFKVERKNRRQREEVYVYPTFSLFLPEKQRSKEIYITQDRPMQVAFEQVLKEYAALRNLTAKDIKGIQPPAIAEWRKERTRLVKQGFPISVELMKRCGLWA